jgi:hypothetical protein
LREQVENHGRPVRRSFFLHKAELGFFHVLEIVTGWLVLSAWSEQPEYSLAGTFHCRRSGLLKTGFFRQVRELKIQRKKSRQCFSMYRVRNPV